MSRRYVGLENDDADWQARVALVRDALAMALKNPAVNPDTQCLKIFMLPEFFFRGILGGYSLETAGKLTRALIEVAQDPAFKDWLFVFGTILARARTPDNQNEAYNFALIQKGNAAAEDTRVVMKSKVSVWDFINEYNKYRFASKDTLLLENTTYPPPVTTLTRDEEKQKNYDGQSVFQQDNLKIGLEICLDHLNGRIKNWQDNTRAAPLDIHLVTASGMALRPEKLASSPDGLAFLNDGSATPETQVISRGQALAPANEDTWECPQLGACFAENKAVLSVFSPVQLSATQQ